MAAAAYFGQQGNIMQIKDIRICGYLLKKTVKGRRTGFQSGVGKQNIRQYCAAHLQEKKSCQAKGAAFPQ